MEACKLCQRKLPERERTTLWAGRHYHTRIDTAYREEYVIVLCGACADDFWPRMRDLVRAVQFRVDLSVRPSDF